MGANSLPNLDSPLESGHLFVTLNLSGIELQSIQESDRVVPTIDVGDNVAVIIFLQAVGLIQQVGRSPQLFHDSPRPDCSLDFKSNAGSRGFVFIEVDALQIHIPIGGSGAGKGDTQCGDFLHQMLVVGVHGIQAVHHVIFFLVGGGVAQSEQGAELFQALLGLFTFHALRLIDDQNGICFGNDVDGLAATEGVQLFVNDSLVFAGIERLHIDDHDIDSTV